MSAIQQPQSTSIHSPLPFLHLPLEVQYQICSHLCRHCQGRPSSPSITLSQLAGTSFNTLKALSETCHALKELAQPILYHYPDIHTYTPFFKTVIARPELAASVRIFARLYESDWTEFKWGPPRHNNEDFEYLIKLGHSFILNDDESQEYPDRWAEDNVNFKRCFRYLEDSADGDQDGCTTDMAYQAYFSLLTALHFMILPNLEFVMIDIYDGRREIRARPLNSGQLLLPYPYLSKAVEAKPEHFARLDTIVLRNTYHYRQDSLGLERIAFLFPVIRNIRVAFFEFLHGEKPYGYQEPHSLSPPPPELTWLAVPRLEEVYFDPCVRSNEPAPLIAICNMLQLCTRLKRFTYRHKYPDQSNSVLFSPTALLNAIIAAKETLLHLEMHCNSAKIPSFPPETLLDHRLTEFSLLTTLVIDEELFCHHWLSDAHPDSCLVDILPDNIEYLTIRLHDKFKAVADVIRLGRDVAAGHHSRLSHLQVHVLHDSPEPEDVCNMNRSPDAFNSNYLLHGVTAEEWHDTLQELATNIRPTVVAAFRGTDVVVEVKYVLELVFSLRRTPFE